MALALALAQGVFAIGEPCRAHSAPPNDRVCDPALQFVATNATLRAVMQTIADVAFLWISP
jgi:hypothetical protein